MKKHTTTLIIIFIFIVGIYYFFEINNKKISTQKNIAEKMNKTSLDKDMFAKKIIIKNIAQNPEGIEYNKNDNTFLLSSLNASPVLKVNFDGTYEAFTSGEKFPLSTAGLQIDYKRNRLLVAGFNGAELMDKNPETKGVSFLRIYDLKTGVLQKDIKLSHLVPNAKNYFANDIAIDEDGNAYVSDWYANLIYKVTTQGEVSVFWINKDNKLGGPNGLDYMNGNLLTSVLTVDDKGLYTNYALLKIPTNNPKKYTQVSLTNKGFRGFDGLVIKPNGNIIGITNNGETPGGNMLTELTSEDNWVTATIINLKAIKPSTTVALTEDDRKYVINQDFSDNSTKNWVIGSVSF
jgi:hypothetical protein